MLYAYTGYDNNDEVSTTNRDLIGELDEDKVFINENPAKFAGDLNQLMALLDALGW